jgi:hypothetical protein
MGHAIGDVLGLAAGVAVSPLPIVAIILILATPRRRRNGLLFTFGWVLGLAALGTIMVVIGGPGGASTNHHPATWVGGLKLALGVLLVLWGPGSGTDVPQTLRRRNCRHGWPRSTTSPRPRSSGLDWRSQQPTSRTPR